MLKSKRIRRCGRCIVDFFNFGKSPPPLSVAHRPWKNRVVSSLTALEMLREGQRGREQIPVRRGGERVSLPAIINNLSISYKPLSSTAPPRLRIISYSHNRLLHNTSLLQAPWLPIPSSRKNLHGKLGSHPNGITPSPSTKMSRSFLTTGLPNVLVATVYNVQAKTGGLPGQIGP